MLSVIRIIIWVGHLCEFLFYIYMFMYLYIAALRKFLHECVMLCIAWHCLLCVASLDQLVLVCYVFMLLPWYSILPCVYNGADCVCLSCCLGICWIVVLLYYWLYYTYFFGLPTIWFVLILRICVLTLLVVTDSYSVVCTFLCQLSFSWYCA